MSLYNLELCLFCGKIVDYPTPSRGSRLPCVLCQGCFEDQALKAGAIGANATENCRDDLEIAPLSIHKNSNTVPSNKLAKDDASRQARAALRDSIALSEYEEDGFLKSSNASSSADEINNSPSKASSGTSLDSTEVVEQNAGEEEKNARLVDGIVLLNHCAEDLEQITKTIPPPNEPSKTVDFGPRIIARFNAMMEDQALDETLSSTQELKPLALPAKLDLDHKLDNHDEEHPEKLEANSSPSSSNRGAKALRRDPSTVGKFTKSESGKVIGKKNGRFPIAIPTVTHEENEGRAREVHNPSAQPSHVEQPAQDIQEITFNAPPDPPKDTTQPIPSLSPSPRSPSKYPTTRRVSPDSWNNREAYYDNSKRGRSPTFRPGTNSMSMRDVVDTYGSDSRLERMSEIDDTTIENLAASSLDSEDICDDIPLVSPRKIGTLKPPSIPSTKPQTPPRPLAKKAGDPGLASKSSIPKPTTSRPSLPVPVRETRPKPTIHRQIPATPVRETRASILRQRVASKNVQSKTPNALPKVYQSPIPQASPRKKSKVKNPRTDLKAVVERRVKGVKTDVGF
jgi:hypothetical protein